MKIRHVTVAVFIVTSVVPASLAQEPATIAHQRLDAIGQEAAEASKAGVVIDVEGCGISIRKAYGVANRKTKTLMPLDEQLRLASISKLYTAAIIHHLAGEGALSLDTPIADYLGVAMDGVPNGNATLRQLLNHTSGIPDYYDWRSYLFWDWQKPLTSERVLTVAKRRKATGRPGEAYSYSNTNYHLLAMAAERVSGKSLQGLMNEIIFNPLSLNDTRYNINHPGGTIHGYGTQLRSWADTWKYAENTGPDSGITATTVDLKRFLQAVFYDNGKLKTLGDEMRLSRVEAGSSRRADGAGAEFYIGRDGLELVGHTGDIFGYLSFAFVIPDYQATLIAHVTADKKDIFTSMLRQTVSVLREVCIE